MSLTMTVLACGAVIAVFLVYLVLLGRTVKMLSPEEQARFMKQGSSVTRSLVAGVPMLMAFFVDDAALRAGCAVLACVLMAWEGWREHARLVAQGFDHRFVRRMAIMSVLAGVGVLLLLANVVLS